LVVLHILIYIFLIKVHHNALFNVIKRN